jgi:hypothetical protein
MATAQDGFGVPLGTPMLYWLTGNYALMRNGDD